MKILLRTAIEIAPREVSTMIETLTEASPRTELLNHPIPVERCAAARAYLNLLGGDVHG